MTAETDDAAERSPETNKTPSGDSALIAWLSVIHSEIRDLSGRVGRLEERVARIEGGMETERAGKNRAIMWLGIGVAALGALAGVAGVVLGVISLLN